MENKLVSEVDLIEIQNLISQMGPIAKIPSVHDALVSLANVLCSAGDKDAFVAAQITEAIASLNVFLLSAQKDPESFINFLNTNL